MVIQVKIFYCDHSDSSKEVRKFITERVNQLKKNKTLVLEVIQRRDQKPVIEIDNIPLKTNYEKFDEISKDVNDALVFRWLAIKSNENN